MFYIEKVFPFPSILLFQKCRFVEILDVFPRNKDSSQLINGNTAKSSECQN